jgi:hypothetical protein
MRNSRSLFVLLFLLFPAGRAALGQGVPCSSDDGRRNYCSADTSQGVTMIKQRSEAACTQGYSWDFDYRGVWVDHGCRADFALQARPDADDRIITCSSEDGGRHYCKADARRGAQLVRQRSGSPCIQGSTWDFDEHGIWVDKGCRADFAVETRDRHENTELGQTIACSSDDGRRNYCPVDTSWAEVRLVKQRSGSPCTEGSTWGFDQQQIWVDRGCRADFAVVRSRNQGRKNCVRSVGERRAYELVEQCRQVSPGTHPPCNAENTCKMITDEIRRSCELLGRDAPGFCDEYR